MTNKDFKFSLLMICNAILFIIAFASKNYVCFNVIMIFIAVINFFSHKFIKE